MGLFRSVRLRIQLPDHRSTLRIRLPPECRSDEQTDLSLHLLEQ